MDYSTRYPEATTLKNIDTETVAEGLLDMYSRVGVSEELLSNRGTQFTSDCMKKVSRLLFIRRLTTSTYHPTCNGLVKKFNGTLKQMLRRLCNEQPRQWHRFINSLFLPSGKHGKKLQDFLLLSCCMEELWEALFKFWKSCGLKKKTSQKLLPVISMFLSYGKDWMKQWR